MHGARCVSVPGFSSGFGRFRRLLVQAVGRCRRVGHARGSTVRPQAGHDQGGPAGREVRACWQTLMRPGEWVLALVRGRRDLGSVGARDIVCWSAGVMIVRLIHSDTASWWPVVGEDQTPLTTYRADGVFDHPAARQDLETAGVVGALDDVNGRRRHGFPQVGAETRRSRRRPAAT